MLEMEDLCLECVREERAGRPPLSARLWLEDLGLLLETISRN